MLELIMCSVSIGLVAGADIQPMSLKDPPTNFFHRETSLQTTLKEHSEFNIENQIHTSLKGLPLETSKVGKIHKKRVQIIKSTTTIAIVFVLLHQIYQKRNYFPSKDDIQNRAFYAAAKVEKKGPIGVVYYFLALVCCEAIGMTTLPIEVAGGFVFGLRKGFVINAVGKVGGAMLAYSIGRTFLASRIRSKFLSQSEKSSKKDGGVDNKSRQIITLVQTCINKEPFTTALVMRFSFFPQLFKNLILSAMERIDWKLFFVVTCIHVLPFTLLFSCLGHDSALRMRIPDLEKNRILMACVFISTMNGMFGGTSVVAFWYHKKKNVIKH